MLNNPPPTHTPHALTHQDILTGAMFNLQELENR